MQKIQEKQPACPGGWSKRRVGTESIIPQGELGSSIQVLSQGQGLQMGTLKGDIKFHVFCGIILEAIPISSAKLSSGQFLSQAMVDKYH